MNERMDNSSERPAGTDNNDDPDRHLVGSASTSSGHSLDAAKIAFVDARVMHAMALERLAASDVRDAAEKAWCATKRATDGLVIARTGETPRKAPDTTRMLRELAIDDLHISHLRHLYSTARDQLHGDCFYSGMCEPLDDTLDLIRSTSDYIKKAEHLASLKP